MPCPACHAAVSVMASTCTACGRFMGVGPGLLATLIVYWRLIVGGLVMAGGLVLFFQSAPTGLVLMVLGLVIVATRPRTGVL